MDKNQRAKLRLTLVAIAMTGIFLGVFLWIKRAPVTRWDLGESYYLQPVGGIPDGSQWTHTFGPDFHVYHAGEDGGVEYGAYFGNHPSFSRKAGGGELVSMRLEQGRLRWLISDRGDSVRAGTLVELDGEWVAHLFISGPTEESVREALDGFSSFRLEPVSMEKYFLDWEAYDQAQADKKAAAE